MPMIRRVVSYSGLNYYEVLELPLDVFLLMQKNSIIDDLNKTEEGQKYLEDCKRLNTTSLDLKALMQFDKKK
jgi:hypothetical protein